MTAPGSPPEIDTVCKGSCLIDLNEEAHPMRRLAITLQVLLSLLFLFSATMKLTGGTEDVRLHLGIAPWFWALTAMVETFGAVGLLAGLNSPRLAVLAGLWLGATMLGGIVSHALVGDPPAEMLAATVLLALALTVVALRWRGAQIGHPATAPTGTASSQRAAGS